eukprot:12889582-Prorocentrum_lima.AAC.1
MTSSSPIAGGAADPRPDSSTGSGAQLLMTCCGASGGGGGARDFVGSATPGTRGARGCAPTRSRPRKSALDPQHLHSSK